MADGWLPAFALIAGLFLLALFFYWLLFITEGVFVGERLVVWLYDLTADRYDAIKKFDAEEERLQLAQPILLALEGGDSAPLLLDVATGTGRAIAALLSMPAFEGHIIGVDASAQMLAQAQKKLAPFAGRFELKQAPAAALPFPPNSFDGAVCLESLEFFPDDKAALAEMARVLQPGAPLIVSRRTWVDGKFFLRRYRSAADFERMLAEVGFCQIEMRPWQVDYNLYFARNCP